MGGVEIVIFTQLGNRNVFDEVLFEDGNLLGAGKMATLFAHNKPPLGLN